MKHVASAALAVSALGLLAFGAGSAHAQDSWTNWAGAYAGINGGYSWDQDKLFSTSPQVPGSESATIRPQGGFGGGQLGYNWQMHNFVFGLETDFQYRDNKVSSFGNGIVTENKWFGTVRPRLGYAFPTLPVLVYGTGGLAYGDIKDTVAPIPGFDSNSRETTRIGWTAGGGVEYAVGRWSVGVEYLHLDLGKDTVSTPLIVQVVPAFNTRFTDTSDAVRLKINFRFWAPHAPIVEAPPPAPAPMPVAAPAPAPAPQARTFIVFFDFDKYNLTPDARKVVEEAANAYKAGGSAKVTLAGYTDLSGSIPYNLRLSERRAKTVAAYMSKQGVPASAMDVSWHGKENPRVPTPDGVREPQNRRVEISE